MLKPRPGGFNEAYRASLLGKIRALGSKLHPSASPTQVAEPRPNRAAIKRPRIVAIGASTGGIHALNLFLRRLPERFDLPILITQHLPESFIPVFARQMQTAANREAVLADEGVVIEPRRIIIAPGHGHMVVRKSHGAVITGLAHYPVKSGCRPSVDPMFETLADAYDGEVAGVLLSGMGRDGTEGAERIAAMGGGIYAQNQASCAVWGMPRAVSESGLACAVEPPERLAERVAAAAGVATWR
jgi:two-component system, chemotaxis family, protein-glutamate methylesterase/glutaminase